MHQKFHVLKKNYKEKLKQLPKECSFCNNLVDMNLSNFTKTYDKVNMSFEAATNSFTTSKSFVQQNNDEKKGQTPVL
jgi:arginyl-tRNA synthetase